ncbi:hypothetical protein HF1_04150 [Mycoplasma haemofelis str. Langford 1]|uniref:Uncharacterized protein n=1 Tax=Mycoplasma haemofelis (strain Langford 1) TaxID=941640 RepID=E8ZH02_MYCHL|nr:hypothetical protein [Mycoplasma haemofelis]CBY92423.1 hypothetical protein HF1_04150 [Mycoplasma haemofelis str. Langford 1]
MIKYGLASAAAAGAAGTGIWYSGILSNNSKSISSLIQEDKTIILIKGDNEWNEKWTAYKNENKDKKGGEDSWGLKGWTSNPVSETILEAYKSKCSSTLKEQVSDRDDKKYKEAVKYCARDKKISDLFSEKGVTLLSKSDQDDKWKIRWEKLKSSSGESLQGFTFGSSDTKENSFSKLSTACETAFNKPLKETNYLNNFESIKKWCSAESTFE